MPVWYQMVPSGNTVFPYNKIIIKKILNYISVELHTNRNINRTVPVF